MAFRIKKPPRRRQPLEQYEKNRTYTYRSRRAAEPADAAERSRGSSGSKGQGRFGELVRSAVFIAGLLVFVAIIAYATVLGTNAKVQFKGDQAALRPAGQYSEKAEGILRESLNNRWKLSIKRSDIADGLKQSFPEIGTVSVSTPPWSYQPIINISVSKPSVLLSSSGSKYLVDDSGVAMINLKDAKKGYKPSGLPLVTDETRYEVEEGKHILSSDQIDFINEIIYQTNQKKLSTQQILLKPGGEEVHFKFNQLDYEVKFSFSNDARKSAGAFLALKKHLDKKGPLPKEYIDARVPERAYVR